MAGVQHMNRCFARAMPKFSFLFSLPRFSNNKIFCCPASSNKHKRNLPISSVSLAFLNFSKQVTFLFKAPLLPFHIPNFIHSLISFYFYSVFDSQLVMRSHLPAGFRFHPTDHELIHCYLSKKITGSLPPEWEVIVDIDLYKFNPWELPEKAFFGEREWFFFTKLDQKYPNGSRPNRAAASGYWKVTGNEKPILASDGTECIGIKKALVFYMGQPRKGTKTEWVMHEYRLVNSLSVASQSQKQKGSLRLDVWVLCQIRQKANISLERNEVAETYSPPHSTFSFIDQKKENAQVDVMNNSSIKECCVNQHLNHPMESFVRRDSTMNDSAPSFFKRYSQLSDVENNFEEAQQLPWTQSMEPDFSSMKRNTSFSLLDELMFLQPAKRLHCSTETLFSSTELISINRSFPEFI